MHRIIVLCLAFGLDFAIGEPERLFYFLPHPVRLIGKAEEALEWVLRRAMPKKARLAGIILCLTVVGGTYLVTLVAVNAIEGALSHWSVVVLAALLYTAIALKGLTGEAAKITGLVKAGEMDKARARLKSLVGRDTAGLDAQAALKAVIESLAENASDGVLAPVFYYLIGGLPLAMAYKAINTLDSMVGYKNEKYRLFGWASARVDDLANLLPSRITGLSLCIASAVMGFGFMGPAKTMFRDGRKHPSPNSGVPMAAMAGALDITLGGPAAYGGRLVEKPFIGRGHLPLDAQRAEMAQRLTTLASLLGAGLMAVVITGLASRLLHG